MIKMEGPGSLAIVGFLESEDNLVKVQFSNQGDNGTGIVVGREQ